MKLSTRLRLRRAMVWVSRLIVGTTFIISGWAKAIDPWGFVIKVNEYLEAWGLSAPHEAVVAACVTLACIEFLTGILLATGSLKRTSALLASAMMLVMLPLTLYIAVANPVADCGCFGDFVILSNWATFGKNVVLSILSGYLLVRNKSVGGLYPGAIQWLEITVSLTFPLFLALAGYQIQPLIDFRPQTTGTPIFTGIESSDTEELFVYEKDGERRQFSLDALPDSTWTFVEAEESADSEGFGGGIAVNDSEGYDIADEIVDDHSRQIFLIVPEPDMHYLIHAHYVERMAEFARRTGVEFIAIVGAQGVDMERWSDWTRPDFPVYTADATALKQLVRGIEAFVYTDGGIIQWKRTLQSMPSTLPDSVSAIELDRLKAPDDGHTHTIALMIYLASMLVIYLLGLSPKVIRLFVRLGKMGKTSKSAQ